MKMFFTFFFSFERKYLKYIRLLFINSFRCLSVTSETYYKNNQIGTMNHKEKKVRSMLGHIKKYIT